MFLMPKEKRMRKIEKTIVIGTLLIGLLGSSVGFAHGGMHGGGGIGVRCNGKLELLDLFEARQQGFKLIKEPTSNHKAIELAAQKLTEHFWNPETIPFKEAQDMVRDTFITAIYKGSGAVQTVNEDGSIKEYPLVSVAQLPLSNDTGLITLPTGCQLEQIIFFDDQEQNIIVIKSKLNELSRLDRMALVIHEVAYLQYRMGPMNVNDPYWGKDRMITSQETREFVARLFGLKPLPPRSSFIPDLNVVPANCTDYDKSENLFENAFYSLNNNTEYLWSFKYLYNYWAPYLTYAKFDYNFQDQLMDLEHGTVNTRGTIFIDKGFLTHSGLEIEVKKSPGQAPEIRMLNSQHEYIDQGPRRIFCDPEH